MLIRGEQMQALEDEAVAGFENRTLEHLRQFFPKQCEFLGEERMRQIIRHRWERAKSFEVVSERGVWQFIDISLMLGASFDSDPKLPWAGEMIRDRTSGDEISRMEGLFRKTLDYFKHFQKDLPAAGAETSGLGQGMLRIRKEPGDVLTRDALPEFSTRLIWELANYFQPPAPIWASRVSGG